MHQCKALPSVCLWATGIIIWVYSPQKQRPHQNETATAWIPWVLLLCGCSAEWSFHHRSCLLCDHTGATDAQGLHCAVISFMTNDFLNALMFFLSVIHVNNPKKEFQHMNPWEGGDLGVIWQIKARLSTANNMLPFERGTHMSLDNKTLILCWWRMQKCSLKSIKNVHRA